jgi:hypothetical protein
MDQLLNFYNLTRNAYHIDRRYSRRRLSSYSPEYRGPSRSRSDRHSRGRERERDQDGDHYIPNYDRDGYAPGPKYSQMPENAMQYGYAGVWTMRLLVVYVPKLSL